jgi:hypothetical protein
LAVADITGITGCILSWNPRSTGFTSSGDGTAVTAVTDASASGNDSTGYANGSSGATHDASPPGDLLGPALAYASGATGYATGIDLADNTWWVAVGWRTSSSMSGYQNLFSSQGGAAEGSLFTNEGVLTYQESDTEPTSTTLLANTFYVLILVSTATGYECFVDDVSVDTFATIGTPTDQPASLEFHAYGGSTPGISGHVTGYAVGTGALSTGDRATLQAAFVEEAEGASASADLSGAPALPAITASGVVDVDVAASGAATLPAITASGVADVDVAATGAATIPAVVGQGTATVSTPASYTGAATLPAITGTGEVGLGLTDAFDGDRDLVGWATVNPSAIPAANTSVANDRLLIEVDDNTGDITLWFNGAAGQLKLRLTGWPFRLVIRNCGVGLNAANTQTALTVGGGDDPYNFFFLQINNDPANPEQNYFHVAVGLQGASGFGGAERCVETKTNNGGTSTVANSGLNSLTGTRADIEIIGTAGKSITCSYSEPAAESWNSLTVPGTLPTFGDTVAFGFGAYALGNDNVPFVATADSIELNGVAIVGAITLPAVTGAGVADVDVAAQGSASLHAITASGQAGAEVAASGASALPAIVSTGVAAVEVDGVGAATLPAITGAGIADVDVGASGSPQLPAVIGAGTGTIGDTAYLSGAATLPAVTASGAGNVDVAATGSATLPALTAAGVADVDVVGQGAGVLPAVVGAGTLTGPITTPTTSGRITVTAGPDARLTATATAAARITVEVTAA